MPHYVRHFWLHLVLISTLLLITSWYMLAGKHFISSDTHLRWVQIEQLQANGWQTLAIDYPMREFDPDLRHTPYYFAFSVVEGQIFFQISPFFPIITAYLYHVLGTLGLAILPAGGTILTAVALYHLTRLAGLPQPLLVMWATIIATPLLFYSFELWDHTVGTALAMWGVLGIAYGLQRDSIWALVGGGIALGFGLGQRPELYVFTLAVGLGLLVLRIEWRLLTAVVLGGLIGALPVWLLQWLWVGHPLGMAFAPHLFGYGLHPDVPRTEGYPTIVKIWYLSLGSQSEGIFTLTATLLVLIGYIFLAYTLHRGFLTTTRSLWLPLAMLTLGYLLWLWQVSENLIVGILPTFPLFAIALIYPRQHFHAGFSKRIYHFVGLTTLIFLLLMLAFWPTYGGTQWGSRYLLPVYPLLLWLAWYVYESYGELLQNKGAMQKMWQNTVAVLFMLSFCLQLGAIWHLHNRHQQIRQLQQQIADIPANIIATDHIFLSIFMSPLQDKNMLYIRDGHELQTIIHHLDQAHITQIGIFPGSELAPPPPPLDIPATLNNGRPLQQIAPFTYQWPALNQPVD